MCNLYSVTTNQEAIRRLLGVSRDLTGNLPPLRSEKVSSDDIGLQSISG
jgi:hypothetical protein